MTEKNKDTKEQILDIAGRMIMEKQSALLRIDELVKVLGFSRQNLYHYFKNKNALLDAVRRQLRCPVGVNSDGRLGVFLFAAFSPF